MVEVSAVTRTAAKNGKDKKCYLIDTEKQYIPYYNYEFGFLTIFHDVWHNDIFFLWYICKDKLS